MNLKDVLEEKYGEEKAAGLYEGMQRDALYCAREITSHPDIPSDPVLGKKIADAFMQFLALLVVKQEALKKYNEYFTLKTKVRFYQGSEEEVEKQRMEDYKKDEEEESNLNIKRIRLMKESPDAIAADLKYKEIRAQISLFTWQFIEGLAKPNYEFDPKDTKIPKEAFDLEWKNDFAIFEKNNWLEGMDISSFDVQLKKIKLGITEEDKQVEEMVGEKQVATQSETNPDYNTITLVKRKMDKSDLQTVKDARSSGLVPKATYEIVRALSLHSIWRQHEHMEDLGLGQIPQRFKGIVMEFAENHSPSQAPSR